MFGWFKRANQEKASKRERRRKWEKYAERTEVRLRRAELGAQEFEAAKDAKDQEAADRALEKMRDINRERLQDEIEAIEGGYLRP